MSRPEFTKEQEEWICYVIGDWYLDWKNKIANYDDRTNKLGYAKEQLKLMLCGLDSDSKLMEPLCRALDKEK